KKLARLRAHLHDFTHTHARNHQLSSRRPVVAVPADPAASMASTSADLSDGARPRPRRAPFHSQLSQISNASVGSNGANGALELPSNGNATGSTRCARGGTQEGLRVRLRL